MEKIKLMMFKILLKKYALGYLVQGWEKLKGYKTQVAVALMVLTYSLEQAGQIPSELSKQIYPYLEAMAGFAFLQKLQRVQPYVDELKKEVVKP
jgi:hypothetical protein